MKKFLKIKYLSSILLKNAFEVNLMRIVCNKNTKFIRNVTCSVQPSLGEHGSYNIEAHVQPNKTVPNLIVKLSAFRNVNRRYQIYFGIRNIPIDICRFFNNGLSSNLMNIFADDLKKQSNVFHPCPFMVIY